MLVSGSVVDFFYGFHVGKYTVCPMDPRGLSVWGLDYISWLFNQPPPGPRTPPRNKGLIAGLIKGNQWLISPKKKALFLRGGTLGGVG